MALAWGMPQHPRGRVASISDEKLQELRDRVDLAAVVQRRVQLKKSGRDLRGLCPFHGEKTPSFYVVPDKRIFHCFGCGKTGDAIKFVMELEGKSFPEAAQALALEAGIELSPQDPQEARRAARRAALGEVNEKACTFFERVLWEHPKGKVAREHLAKRGISVETAKAWRLGYAPNLWDALCKSLAQKKVEASLVEEAGLGIPRGKGPGKGTLYDRFRGRLTIPIRESGRIVAFGGRLLEGESEAKYLNSPETPLYHKGQILFALDRAREAVRREGVALFTEGYFDAIGLHQAGIATAVATCGTAMTERHLELVSRAGAKELVFIFDGDAAGIRAATRASELAAAAGVTARVLVPPDGEDPDETVARTGTNGFRELLAAAQPALEFLLDRELLRVGKDASVEARVRTVEAVRGIVRAAPPGLARDLYIDKVAQKLGAPLDAVRMALEAPARAEPRSADPTPLPQRPPVRAGGARMAAGPARQRSSGEVGGNRTSQQGQARSPARPEAAAARAQAPRPAARRSAPQIELKIVAQMLQGAELALLVESSGAAARFTHAGLRELAERAFAQARAGSLDAAALVQSVEHDALRDALGKVIDEIEAAGRGVERDQAFQATARRALESVLRKHASVAGQEEIGQRNAAASPRVAHGDREGGQKTGA
jgi:DNA primase